MGRRSVRKPRQEQHDVAVLLAAARRLCAQYKLRPPMAQAAIWCRRRSSALLRLPHVSLDIELLNTYSEPCAEQPPSFRSDLRVYDFQLRSLGWMLAREHHASGRLTSANEEDVICIRGGILADGVGFGKTTITLALLDHLRGPSLPCHAPPPLTSYFIPSRASVIISPPNLWEQWNKEIQKFLHSESLKIIAAADIKVLKQCTVDDIAQADVLVLSYKFFDSPQYKDRLAHFGSGGQGTRCFVRALLETCENELRTSEDEQLHDGTCSAIPSTLGGMKFPVLELFYFHRIIVDEFHELVCAVGQDSHPFYRAMVSLCELHARSRWGLTSTPPLKSLFEVATTAAFFHVDLTTSCSDASSAEAVIACQELCTDFVHNMVRRSNSQPADALPELSQSKVLVQMTRHESALYHMAAHDSKSRTGRLLELSSLHRPVAPSEQDKTTASDLCREELQERRRPILQLEQDMRKQILEMECQKQLVHLDTERQYMLFEDLLSNLHERGDQLFLDVTKKHEFLDRSVQVREAVTKRSDFNKVFDERFSTSRKFENDGHKAALTFLMNENKKSENSVLEARTKDCAYTGRWTLQELRHAVEAEKRNLQQLADLYTPLLLFQSALARSGDGFTCPICFEEAHKDAGCIASCTHVACFSCWGHIFRSHVDDLGRAKCPICRRVLSRQEVLPLSGHVADFVASTKSHELQQLQRRELGQGFSEAWALRFAGIEDMDDLARYSAYGTKTRCTIETVLRIRSSDGQAKVLIFVQWEVMKQTLNIAFDHFQIPHVDLRGSTYERAALLRQFARPDGPWAMLLSMEFSPSGLNLVAANHLVLVQPTWHENSHEKSVDFEEQAIGRCWRQGQERTVHVWRLCTESTLEEEFVDEHIRIWESRVGRRR